jgi:hypothetical protein
MLYVFLPLQNDDEKRWIAQQILSKVQVSSGIVYGLSPLQIEATSRSVALTRDEPSPFAAASGLQNL